MSTLRRIPAVLVVLLTQGSATIAQAPGAAGTAASRIQWAAGPAKGRLGDVAEVGVPASCQFTDASGAKLFMEATQNPPSGTELGVLLCQGAGSDSTVWFVVFSYSASGRVNDDEQSNLDHGSILKTLQRGTEAGNEERRQRGWSEVEILGWQRPPYYDPATHNLTWSIRLRSKDAAGETVNHSVRLLGRGGVMNADLVADPAQMAYAGETFDAILGDYAFLLGQRYSEWRAGDKVAEYGLTALIAGGAGAAAVKLGLFGKLWKLILVVVLAMKKLLVVVVLGAVVFVKSLFKKRQNASGAAGPSTEGSGQQRPTDGSDGGA